MLEVASLNPLDPALYAAGVPGDNGLPWDLYDYLRVNRPCYRQVLGEPGLVDWTWVVTRHADVVAVDSDPVRFTSELGSSVRAFDPSVRGNGGKVSLLTLDGREHQRLRRILSRGFTPNAISALEAQLRVMAGSILDEALGEDTFDFVESVARQLPMRAICDLLGVPQEDRAQLVHWADVIAAPTDAQVSGGMEGMLAAAQGIWDYAVSIAALKRDEPAEDLITKVAAAHDAEVLTEEEVMGMMLLLVVAGNETTRNTISHGLHALIRHRDQWELLRDDTDRVIGSAVEEIMRYSCPVIGFSRRATVPVQLHGETIAPGDVVSFCYASANFDPEVFDQPRVLNVQRHPNPHLTFGKGPHVCMGAALARLETRVMFEELVKRVRHVELAGPVVYARDAILRGCQQLPVRVSR